MTTIRVERGDQIYEVDFDTSKRVLEARLYVEAHDKRPTWRRVRNQKTLEILGAMVYGAPICPHCGGAVPSL